MFHDIEIKPAINLDNYCNASVSWELALKAQMSEFGLNVETVAEGVNFLLKLLEAQGKPDGWQPSRFAADANAN